MNKELRGRRQRGTLVNAARPRRGTYQVVALRRTLVGPRCGLAARGAAYDRRACRTAGAPETGPELLRDLSRRLGLSSYDSDPFDASHA